MVTARVGGPKVRGLKQLAQPLARPAVLSGGWPVTTPLSRNGTVTMVSISASSPLGAFAGSYT